MPDTSASSQFNAPDSSPTIQQDIHGDRNQVIGQMLGGIVINQLTIHDRVPAAAAPPPISVAPSLTQQEYRQRQVLLNKVKEYWVKGVLETSLHTRALIELGLQDRSDLVQRPFREVAEFPEVSGQALIEGISATTVFEQMGAGRTLLILGEPGSGKTITLLKLAEDLISRTEKDLGQPIPVVLNISSWAKKSQAIKKWLIQELLEKYQVSKALGKQWVETESLILLLDGLDEVRPEQRNACVQALNQFMQTHGATEVSVCCRIKDYEALTERLTLRSAICIQPLTPEQINSYFKQAGEQLSALKTILRQDRKLQDLATSPLMLSIVSLSYQGCTPEQLNLGGSTEDYRERIFETYIDRMFQRRGTTQQDPRKETQRWLIWLAQRMTVAAQTVFLIERLQPSWLPTREQRIRYRWETGFIGGLSIALLGGLMQGLLYVLFFGLRMNGLMNALMQGLLLGLLLGTSFGVIVGSLGDIKTFETFKWSWQEAKHAFHTVQNKALSNSLIFGLIFGLMGRRISSLIFGLIFGLISSLIFGLFWGLFLGFRNSEIPQSKKPNQGIFRSARNAAILGISIFVIFGMIFGMVGYGLTLGLTLGLGLGLGLSLIFGLVSGLTVGGCASFRHFALRLMLYRQGYAPWNYTRFLDYATERLFLQKVGGGYIFVHRMLLEHFAGMSLEQGQR